MGKKTSFQRLTPYLRGAIYAFFLAGYTLEQIEENIKKEDGTTPCLQTISNTISLCKEEGGFSWGGVLSSATGRGKPRATTSALDKKIVKLVFKERGRAKVTAAFVQKKLKETRKLSARTLQRRLETAGLAWLRVHVHCGRVGRRRCGRRRPGRWRT